MLAVQESGKKSFFKYTLLFLLIFAGAFLAFMIQGKSLVWKGDGFRQYYPALNYLGQYYRTIAASVLRGDFSIPMMDFTIGQGEDILTTFANYGLGDPLTLLAALVPGGVAMEYLYGALIVLRLYLSGVSFWVYCEGMKLSRRFRVYGAITYVFCGFALWSVKDPFFLNALIYLPLVLLGMEFVFRSKTPILLALSVFFSATSGYYFFYMIVIAATGYFALRCLMLYGKQWKLWFRKGIQCVLTAFGGVLLSGVILVPCIYAFLQSSRTESYVGMADLLFYSADYYKDMLVHLIRVTANDSASAVSYLTVAVVALFALVVLLIQKGKQYRPWKLSVLVVALAVASPFAGYVFNGFGYITNRFMFIPVFLISLILVKFMPELFALTETVKRRLILGAVVYVVACLLLTKGDGVWQTLFMAVMIAALLCVLCLPCLETRKQSLTGILLVINLIGNGVILYSGFGTGITELYMERGSVQKAYESEEINLVKRETQGQFVRTDAMMDRGENPNQAVVRENGYYGISVYYSVINPGYATLMKTMENAPDLMYTHRLMGNDGRTILENLANVQYVISDDAALVPYGFEPCGTSGAEKNVYRNSCQTSIGYTYQNWIPENVFAEGSVFERQNTLLEAGVVTGDSSLGQQLKKSSVAEQIQCVDVEGGESHPFDMTDVEHFDWVGGRLKVKKKNGTFSLGLKRKVGYEYYLRLSGLEIKQSKKNTRWATVTLGSVSKSFLISDASYDFHFGRTDYLVHLGSVKEEAGEEIMGFRLNGPAVYCLDNIELVEVPVDTVPGKVEALNKESLQNVEIAGNTLSGTLELSEEKLLCLAVPYKQGYQLYIDGVETEIGEVNKMYVGALISEGKHEVLLQYDTPGSRLGIILTIVGMFYVIFLSILHKKSCVKGVDMI